MQHTATHQRGTGFRRNMPATWWFGNARYFMYMMRELTAVFAALWVVLFLIQVPEMAAGAADPARYYRWLDGIRSSAWWVTFSMIALVFVLYHTFTWFNLMGTVMVVRLGGRRIPGGVITAAMFAAWMGVTIVVGAIIAIPGIGG